MEEWQKLEFYYAKRLRECNPQERKILYSEAYSAVSKLGIKRFSSDDPECRTAGSSKIIAQSLSHLVKRNDRVLEIGCGRGYTSLKLAPKVKSMVGIDVSDSVIAESNELITKYGIKNLEVRLVSAFELKENFIKNEFDACISIDTIEHLHPDDAKEHLRQIFYVLKPGGRYIIQMPNRLNGPHDITKQIFPGEHHALGFHLNESTYQEMIKIMRSIGFNRFKVFIPIKFLKLDLNPMITPYHISFTYEKLYNIFPNFFRQHFFDKLISIRIIAFKPI